MPILKDGTWEPLMTPKQREAYYMEKRYMLLSGPRLAGKTIGAIHKVIKHAWETGDDKIGARIGVFCTTIKVGLSGVWDDIYKLLKIWEADNIVGEDDQPFTVIGNQMTSRGATRQYYMQIHNKYGAVAEFQLHSLEFEGDVEDKFLGSRFSCLYFSELQNFHERSTFDIPKNQLRALGIPYEQHLWIADTNPPEEGDSHWAHQVFFIDPNLEEPPELIKTEEDIREFRRSQAETGLLLFAIDDNPLADPRDIANVKTTYKDDPEGWARFVEGKWVRGVGFKGAWFAKDFVQRRSTIVVGHADESERLIPSEDWERLLPEKETRTLYVGLDPGETNHAGAILQKRFVEGLSTWDVIDEVVHLKKDVMLSEFGEELLSKMTALEQYLGREPDWTCWGDTSLDRWRSNTADGTDANVLMRSVDNKFFIRFAADAKKPKMVRRRLTLLMNLIRNGRLFVSAHCFATIRMLEGLRKGSTEFQHILKGDPNKHIFDAISYAIFSEMLEDNELQINEAVAPDARRLASPQIITAVL
jgi:hypothetical protein